MDRSKRLKILHICKVYYPIIGGVQRVVEQLVRQVPNFNHSVLTTGEDGAISNEMMDGVEIHRSHSYGELASLPLAPALIKKFITLSRENDLLAIHYPFPLADLALMFCWWKKPIIVHWHSNIVAQSKLKWLVAPFTYIMLLRSHSIVVTNELMIEHSSWLRRFKSKVKSIPYCAQANSITPTNTVDSNYFCLIGRHVSYKGFDVAIKALKNNNCRIKIVGNGPLFHQHKRLAEQLEVEDRVDFIQHATDSETADILDNSIAFILSSKSHNEAFALVQLEAMSKGKAIINTDLPSSVPWVARDQQEALTVPPNNQDALSDAMLSLQASPQLAAQLGRAGHKRSQTQFSCEEFSRKIHQLYEDAADHS